MAFKRKRKRTIASDIPQVGETVEQVLESPPTKVLDSELTDFEKVLKHFELRKEDIFVLRDYPDKIVVVTHDGRKLTWPKR